jgi:restriction system protein
LGRKGSFVVVIERIVKEQARQKRQAEVAQQRQAREALRYQREQLRIQAQHSKQQRQQYIESRAVEAEEMTADLTATMDRLRNLLYSSLSVKHTLPFDSLKESELISPFLVPAEFATPKTQPKLEDFIAQVRRKSFIERLFMRKARHQRETAQARTRYTDAHRQFLEAEETRRAKIARLKADYETAAQQKLAAAQNRNSQVDQMKAAYELGDPSAVETYCSLVLMRSQYPIGFPQNFRLAYVPAPKELVVEYELPTVEVVPRISEHRYIKSKDIFEEKARKASEIKETYQDIVAAIALRTLHELIEADQACHISLVIFNGFVNGVDPATGQNIKPYLVSVRSTRERFLEIDLSRVEKKACLRNLGAHVSAQPGELQPVKPLVEFEMVDRRFVEGNDVLSELESRPNLMELSPFEFEQLVGNLFTKMGLEAKQTRSSRDGGVDVVAFDIRPVIGGKVVIQAKRYRHTVGVSAVRDLFGTMNHEGANKGILVTTSTYGPDAYDFIKGKPIELIDGGGLLYYLEQHGGMQARIIFPVEE